MDGRSRWIAALAAVLSLALAGQASAHVYWASSPGIGRANLDGTDADQAFITAGMYYPPTVAVDGGHVYWANSLDLIGRANLDGSQPGRLLSVNVPFGMAVDDQHIYWVNLDTDTIGRANLDGTGVQPNFIAGDGEVEGMAVGGGHIYWGNHRLGGSSIGRANLDGSGIDQNFVTGVYWPRGLAADARHVYWTNLPKHTIGRASADGSGVDQSFITGASVPSGVAVDDRHVYWSNPGFDSIGRANLDGSGVEQHFIAAADNPQGVAVDGGPAGSARASSGSLTFGSRPAGSASAAESLTVTNEGHGNLKVDAARVVGQDSDDFRISADGCASRTLWIGDACTIGVRFAPRASGRRAATLVVPSNDRFSPLEIALGGTGDDAVIAGPASTPTAPPAAAPRTKPSLVVCRKRHGRRRCASRRLVGDVPLPITGTARASLTQGGALYATGTATADRLTLTARRPVPAGRYTLTLRAGGRITARARISIR